MGLPSHIDTVALGKPIAPYGCLNPYRRLGGAGFSQTKLLYSISFSSALLGKFLFLPSCDDADHNAVSDGIVVSIIDIQPFFRNRVAAPFTTAGLQPLNLTVYSCPSSLAGTAKQLNSSCLNFRLDAFVL